MKVILQKDVAKLGKKHSVVEVPDGYALNKLIPQKMAVSASPDNLKRILNLKAEANATYEADESAYKEAMAKLSNLKPQIEAEANAQGHLFKAVKSEDVYACLVKNDITTIPASAIIIKKPIKTCGTHLLMVNFHDHEDEIEIEVVSK